VRRAVPVGLVPGAVEWCTGDVTCEPDVARAMTDVSHVVHLAGLLHLPDPPPRLVAEYDRVNVDGTARVLRQAGAAGVTRVVFASTVCVYGPFQGLPLTEDATPRPDTPYAATKLRAEALVLDAAVSEATVLRLAAVYGPRLKGNYLRLLQALCAKRFVPIGNGTNRRALIYDADAAEAIATALEHPAAPHRIFNVSDGQPHMMQRILSAMASAVGTRVPSVVLPAGTARAFAGLLEGAARLAGRRAPLSRAIIDKYTEDLVVDSRRIESELGFVARTDLEQGWAQTVAALRSRGDLA
jgi:nucleoside-diphosphate-sugar epimerase